MFAVITVRTGVVADRCYHGHDRWFNRLFCSRGFLGRSGNGGLYWLHGSGRCLFDRRDRLGLGDRLRRWGGRLCGGGILFHGVGLFVDRELNIVPETGAMKASAGPSRKAGDCSKLATDISPRRKHRGLIPHGGPDRDRTDDLVIANDALYQLSYRPHFRDRRYWKIAPSK